MRWPPPTDWPHRARSRQIYCRPHRWHVQEMGEGDTVLLLHGAGGSTHSFRDLMPLLAAQYHVVALDLPGQGFTQLGARHRSGLEPTAEDVTTLCAQEGWQPTAIVGHSAGGALALRLSGRLKSPQDRAPVVVGINPALDTFKGLAGVLFPAMAKLLAAVPFTARMFAATTATPKRVQALVASTGSEISAEGRSYYQRLIGDRDHADAALLMMAQWELDGLLQDLPELPARALFIVGQNDKTVPPAVSDKAAALMPNAQTLPLPGLGHLAHEEDPGEIAAHILNFLKDAA